MWVTYVENSPPPVRPALIQTVRGVGYAVRWS
jgi:hypothetical protein